MIKIALVDDHEIIREGMKVLIANDAVLSVVGEAGNLDGALTLLKGFSDIDVLVLDMFLDQENDGMKVLEALKRNKNAPAILIVSMYKNKELVKQCLENGAKGYLTKGDAAKFLNHAIHVVASNKTFISPSILETIFVDEKSPVIEDEKLNYLTKREWDILELLGKGLTNRRISTQLSISTSTVSTHLENIKSKLHFEDIHELIRFAIQREQEQTLKNNLFQ